MSASEAGPAAGVSAVAPAGRAASSQPWRGVDVILCVAAAGLALGMAFLYLSSRYSGGSHALVGLPLDDTWIHLVYARSLAEHGWFYYNPGVAEAGMSSPLWVVILGIAYRILTPLGVSAQWCAKAPALLFALGVPVMTYVVAARTLGLDRRWAFAAAVLVAVDANLAYGSVAGMEAPLLCFLTLLAVYLLSRERYLATGIVLGLGVITRAEGTITAILIGAIPLVREYLKRREITLVTVREMWLAARLFLPSLVLGGAWALYNHSVNGTFLPNTFYVKHYFGLGVFNWTNLMGALGGFVRHLALFRGWLAVISGLLIAAFAYSLRHEGRQRLHLRLAVLLVPIAQIWAFSVNIKVAALPWPWTYATRRYLDYLIPLLIILVVGGAQFVWSRISKFKHRIVVLAAPLAVPLVLYLALSGVAGLNRTYVEWYSWDTENIEDVSVAMGKWVARNLPPGATVAVTDAGAVRFYARPDQEIIDFVGLNTHRCMGQPCAELLNEFKPQYAVFFRFSDPAWGYFEELHSLKPVRHTILGGGELVAVKVNGYPPWPPE
jgi:hypothetical protein